ncbi:ATP synthase F1 subunit epsilon [Kineothrix sp. MB12-C1]|uniref:ATP synthase F1 subunit epsilon n=1 Tax=Kineothrix sp. MB12-C1 TaxID=3070215 RepID=UPI0027D1F835|nr:ATP synthase F1 subunit epsilon [Kineothrix sp. MB12-C1]WMC93975.1 ATP synthase F1 subunit epsilon [Kineothrix sp. MB12-C1]
MNTFYLKVIAADRIFHNGRCESLILPTLDGMVGVLANHENMVIAVVEGDIKIRMEDGNEINAVVGLGFFEMVNNRARLLVQTAEKPEEIDIRRAQEAQERAQERLRQQQSIREHYHTQATLSRAMNRLKVSRKYK